MLEIQRTNVFIRVAGSRRMHLQHQSCGGLSGWSSNSSGWSHRRWGLRTNKHCNWTHWNNRKAMAETTEENGFRRHRHATKFWRPCSTFSSENHVFKGCSTDCWCQPPKGQLNVDHQNGKLEARQSRVMETTNELYHVIARRGWIKKSGPKQKKIRKKHCYDMLWCLLKK